MELKTSLKDSIKQIYTYQAGPFRAGVIRFGWTELLSDHPERFLWAYELPANERSDHEALSKDVNWVRIYTPGWYYLSGTSFEDIQVTPCQLAEHKVVVHKAEHENEVWKKAQEHRAELERARAAGFKV